jgi:hypothetical protein
VGSMVVKMRAKLSVGNLLYMFNLRLFLGLQADEAFQKALQQVNPYLISIFVGKEEYLQEILHDGKCYLGKFLSPFPSLDQLTDVERHLLSLLKQVAPRFCFSERPLVLLTIHD